MKSKFLSRVKFCAVVLFSIFLYNNPVSAQTTYSLVTSTSDLVNGEKYIIVGIDGSSYYAVGSTQNTNNRAAVSISAPVNNEITINTEAIQAFTLGTSGTNYTFYDPVKNGYLYAASSGSNYLRTQSTNNANGEWAITFSGNVATVVAQGTNTRNTLQFNISSKIFSCYTSGQSDVYLYKASSSNPTITVNPTTLSNFTYIFGNGPSAAQSISVSGTNLTANIVLSAPSNYEISTSENGTYGSNLTLNQASGTLSETTIYVRLKAGLATGEYNSELVTLTSTGAGNRTVTLNGTVTPSSYSVTNNLSNINSSNSATTVAAEASYTATLTANASYTISTVTVTMNGTDITATAYNSSTGVISIASVTGDIVITGTSLGTYTLTWNVNGATSTTSIAEGDAIGTLPAAPSSADCDGVKVFVGWTASEIAIPSNTSPTFVSASTIPSGNTTYYAVFASATQAEEVYSLVTNLSDITNGTYIICNGDYYLPSTTTTSSSSPTAETMTTISNGVVTGTVTNDMLWNFSGSNTAMTVTNSDGSYLYTISNNNGLRVYTTSGTWSFATNGSGFSMEFSTTSRYCGASTYNNWRSYNSAAHANYHDGGQLYLYKRTGGTVYTDYSTNCSSDPRLLQTNIPILHYVFGEGPSNSLTANIRGINLQDADGNITLTVSSSDFAISSDNATFSNTLTLPYTESTLNATIFVRLVAGLTEGSYSGSIGVSGGNATSISIQLNGKVTPITSNSFHKGDFAVISVNSNTGSCGETADNGGDEISFITFRDIETNVEFTMTDNGYEYQNAGLWGNREGTITFKRTGSTISAGTVITLRTYNDDSYECISPDNNWTFTNQSGAPLVLNSGGDQIYFMQGGTWDDGIERGTNDAQYVGGELLFAFNVNNTWTSFGVDSKHSGLYEGMDCFSMMPGSATDYTEYTGPTTPATKRDWIGRINNPDNWTNRGSCATFYANNIHYGKTYEILDGGYTEGLWTGDESTDWFDCSNWDDLEVPDSTVNVTIPSGDDVPRDPTISAPPTSPIAYERAECNNIDIQSGRTLTMDESGSRLDIFGNIINNGVINATNGTVNIIDDNDTISGIGVNNFYNLCINKIVAANLFTLNCDINVNNNLILTKGKVNTNDNKVIVTNTATTAISGHGINSYVIGNLRRFVASSGSYDLPVGTKSFYELANINLNSSSALSYLDSKFTNPHTSDISISSLGLYVNSSLLEELLNYGFWTITPDGGTYNYNVTLTSRGHTNQGSDVHSIVKRNLPSDWITEGTHNDATTGDDWVCAKRSALTSFSDFAIAKPEITLPVELISFDVTLDNANGLAKWETASETNCSHYVLQRSTDNQNNFRTIAVIPGAGNTNEIQEYEFTDININEGINYYRLLQYDFDGKENVIGYDFLVSGNKNAAISIANLTYMNGLVAADIFNIKGEKVMVEIVDANGHILTSEVLPAADKACRLIINQPISQGIYFLRVSDSQNFSFIKFLAL